MLRHILCNICKYFICIIHYFSFPGQSIMTAL
uniref:Uncharacterized protein n=1 Tax=Siphoviridae sp. ct7yc1 TaxID=2827788 RepID=A0A8S5TK42_9CAUD|nr:MAG TPA: hypothetical protein [Siphoviridae sp. ct7yc1]